MARPLTVVTGPGARQARQHLVEVATELARADRHQAELRRQRNEAISRGRSAGLTWRELADLAGLASPQAAERIVRNLEGGQP